MLQAIKNIFGLGGKTDYSELIKKGGVIVDVRSKEESASGHIRNAINIPVNELGYNLTKLKDKDQVIICCCASGMRSASARKILQSKGYTAVYNGGGWSSLQNKL